MSAPGAVLVVRAGRRRVALPLEHLIEVVEPEAVLPVPGREPALRGLTRLRGRLLPLIHLGALLDGGPCPEAAGTAAVVIAVGGRRIGLEVEEVEDVLRQADPPVPAGEALPWAAGVARLSSGPIPVLDVAALGGRLAGEPGGRRAAAGGAA